MIIFGSLSDRLLVLFTFVYDSFSIHLAVIVFSLTSPLYSNLSLYLGGPLLSFISHICINFDSFLLKKKNQKKTRICLKISKNAGWDTKCKHPLHLYVFRLCICRN